MMHERRGALLVHLRLAMLWAVLILVLLLMPGSAVPAGKWLAKFHVDKLVHAFLFGVFFVLLVHGFRRQTRVPDLRIHAILSAMCIAVAYGVFTELLQELTDGSRRGDMMDMLANTVGCVVALFLMKWGERRQRRTVGTQHSA